MTEVDVRSLTGLFEDPIFDHPDVRLGPDERDRLTYRQLDRLNEYFAAEFPLVSGNPGLLCDLLEATAMLSPSLFMAFFLHHSMGVGATVDYGGGYTGAGGMDPEGHFGAILMSELGYGSSSARILTEVRHDARTGHFLLSTPSVEAVKFPSNIGADFVARWGIVSARLMVGDVDRGVFLFRLQLRDPHAVCPGVNIRSIPAFPQLQLDYGSASFHDVVVPSAGWLSDGATISARGTFHDPLGGAEERTKRTLSVSRFAHGSNCLGLAAAARASLAIALRHARRRRVNDRDGERRTLVEHSNQQRLLLDGLAYAFAATATARITGASALAVSAEGGRGQGPSSRELRAVSLGKVLVSQLATRAIAAAQQSCGVAGFVVGNRLVDYHNFATTFHNAGGDNQMYLLNAAWGMLARDDYEPPRSSGAFEHVMTPSAAVDTCVDLLRSRESDLWYDLLKQRDLGGGIDVFANWNDLAEPAQRFVEAHVATTAVERLRDHAAEKRDPDDQHVLSGLCLLLAVGEIQKHGDWYSANTSASDAMMPWLVEMARRTRHRLVGLLDTLENLLGAPSAFVRSPLLGEEYARDIAPDGMAERWRR